MYRVSREGRRAHDHGPDSNGGGRSARYNKERVVDAASSSGSSSYAYSDDKSKAFPVAGRAAGVLRTRSSRASLCLKLTATSVGLFVLRGVHRSMCPAGGGSREAELQSRIAFLDQKLEVERASRKTAEHAMEDLRANDRGRAGMPGSGGSDERQQRGAEEEAEQAGLEEQAASHESEPLAHVAGEGQPNTVVTKSDYQTLLRETYEDLQERIEELQILTAKNKDLQEKVASLEEQVESRRQLALGVHGAEGVGGSYHQQQEQQQWPEAEHDSGKPSTVKHRFGVGNFQHSDMAIFANDGISNNNNNDNDNDNGGARGGTGKRTFYENPYDAYEGHQSNEPGVPFEVKGWIVEGEEGGGGGASADFDAGGSMDGNSNSGGGGEHSDPLANMDTGAVAAGDGNIHEVGNFDAGGHDNEAPPIIVGGLRVGGVGDGEVGLGGDGAVGVGGLGGVSDFRDGLPLSDVGNALGNGVEFEVAEGVDWARIRDPDNEDGRRGTASWDPKNDDDDEEEEAGDNNNGWTGGDGGGGGEGKRSKPKPFLRGSRNKEEGRHGGEGGEGLQRAEEAGVGPNGLVDLLDQDPEDPSSEEEASSEGEKESSSGEGDWHDAGSGREPPPPPPPPAPVVVDTSEEGVVIGGAVPGHKAALHEDDLPVGGREARDDGTSGVPPTLPAPPAGLAEAKTSVERMERESTHLTAAQQAEREESLRRTASENAAVGPLAAVVERAHAEAVEALEAAGQATVLAPPRGAPPETTNRQGAEQRAVGEGEEERTAVGEKAPPVPAPAPPAESEGEVEVKSGMAIFEAIKNRAIEEAKKAVEAAPPGRERGRTESKGKAQSSEKAEGVQPERERLQKQEAHEEALEEAERKEAQRLAFEGKEAREQEHARKQDQRQAHLEAERREAEREHKASEKKAARREEAERKKRKAAAAAEVAAEKERQARVDAAFSEMVMGRPERGGGGGGGGANHHHRQQPPPAAERHQTKLRHEQRFPDRGDDDDEMRGSFAFRERRNPRDDEDDELPDDDDDSSRGGSRVRDDDDEQDDDEYEE
ncbi:unnamed protein product [Ectocarpus sp. CCAP 1310/34]|nr:unnamed protein product [Ectocarpus sp. CCAP 1310/34]